MTGHFSDQLECLTDRITGTGELKFEGECPKSSFTPHHRRAALDLQVADCSGNIAGPHKDLGLVIEWCA